MQIYLYWQSFPNVILNFHNELLVNLFFNYHIYSAEINSSTLLTFARNMISESNKISVKRKKCKYFLIKNPIFDITCRWKSAINLFSKFKWGFFDISYQNYYNSLCNDLHSFELRYLFAEILMFQFGTTNFVTPQPDIIFK